jgi:hypothetical protein
MAVKKILCSDANCDNVIAHQLTDKTVELKRLDQMTTATGDNWSLLATCPKHPEHKTSLVVNAGKLDESELRYKDADKNEEDDDKSGDADDDNKEE